MTALVSIYFPLFTMYIIFVKLTHSVDVFPIFVSFKKEYASTIFCAIVRLSSSVGYLVNNINKYTSKVHSFDLGSSFRKGILFPHELKTKITKNTV